MLPQDYLIIIRLQGSILLKIKYDVISLVLFEWSVDLIDFVLKKSDFNLLNSQRKFLRSSWTESRVRDRNGCPSPCRKFQKGREPWIQSPTSHRRERALVFIFSTLVIYLCLNEVIKALFILKIFCCRNK